MVKYGNFESEYFMLLGLDNVGGRQIRRCDRSIFAYDRGSGQVHPYCITVCARNRLRLTKYLISGSHVKQ